ncbi:MAG TPA: ABC transporter permease [Candidatus Solibacter sp.]|jgi:ABC-2 type transport system permease protein|nr:ABC transporter permease [Candidatus Solibacter sp.]
MSRSFRALLSTSLKAYYRNRSAMFFSLLVPLIIMVIFGLLNLGGNHTSENIGVVDLAHNPSSQLIIDNLKKESVLQVDFGSQAAETNALKKGDRALVVVLPAELGAIQTCAPRAVGCHPGPKPVSIPIYTNKAKPQDAQIATAIVTQFFAQSSFVALGQPGGVFKPVVQVLPGQNTTYTDFLVPGIIALSIMQTGIFSVAFAFVQQKQTGVLRRLMATPMKVSEFLAAQVTTRLIMAAVQVAILLFVGVVFFGFHLAGNVVELMLACIFGSAIFIAIGFGISGYAKDEQAVPAIANILVLPMMFLSGIFFTRDSMPAWLHTVSDYLPLTYVVDAIRSVAVNGSHLWNLGTDVIGIAVWLVITVAIAIRLFRWEVV